MKSGMFKRTGISLAAVSSLVLAASFFAAGQVEADSWNKMTLFTTRQPIQVGNTYLEPGAYMFKLSDSNRHVVQIFNRDGSHLYSTIIATPDYRLEPNSRTQFTFWETPTGSVPAMKSWFYPGDNFGQEFRYPSYPPTPSPAATQR